MKWPPRTKVSWDVTGSVIKRYRSAKRDLSWLSFSAAPARSVRSQAEASVGEAGDAAGLLEEMPRAAQDGSDPARGGLSVLPLAGWGQASFHIKTSPVRAMSVIQYCLYLFDEAVQPHNISHRSLWQCENSQNSAAFHFVASALKSVLCLYEIWNYLKIMPWLTYVGRHNKLWYCKTALVLSK